MDYRHTRRKMIQGISKHRNATKMPSPKPVTKKGVINRFSTIVREFSNCLATVPFEVKTDEDIELKCKILNMNGKCEYCEVNAVSTDDHFHPLVKDKLPTDACNDFWNMVPCCGTCNPSKGGLPFIEWINANGPKNPFPHMSDERRERIIAKMTWFETVSNKRRYRKHYDQEKIQELSILVYKMLMQVQIIMEVIHLMTVYTKGIN